MVQPTQLDTTEQDALVKQIGLAMLRLAPHEWDQVTIDYRAVGRYFEADGQVVYSDDRTADWPVPPDITALFARLRAGMYRDGRGTWFNARYRLDHPSSYNLDYDRDEPKWRHGPPPQAFADDLAMFPRSEDNIPEWLLRRANSPAPAPAPAPVPVPAPNLEQTAPRFRMARVFDGAGGNGRPMVNRRLITDEERAEVLNYLSSAPTIMRGRGLEVDRLDPESRPQVPVAFHTDGAWIWPAAVNYYLHTYGVAPEPDLVDHIRRHGFRVPEVDEATLATASTFLSRGAPPAAVPGAVPGAVPPPGMAPPMPPLQPPSRPMPLPGPRTTQPAAPPPPPSMARPVEQPPVMAMPPAGTPVTPPSPPPPPAAPPAPPAAPRHAAGPPAAALPSQGPPSVVIDTLRARLDAAGVPESAYRIGPPSDRAWTMDQTPEGWRVGWYDGEFVAPAMFEDVADAAAFLLGKIMMDDGHREVPEPAAPTGFEPEPEPKPLADEETVVSEPAEPPPPPVPEPEPTLFAPHIAPAPPPPPVAPQPSLVSPRQPSVAVRDPLFEPHVEPAPRPEPEPRPEPRRTAAAASGSSTSTQPSPAGGQRWPIQPLRGEPPLTLFRGKRLMDLAPGTEIDRFGEPDGNLTYAAGTPFPERSLVPEWVERPFHTYQVTRPFEVLTGTSIPWFDQPGGGTAYLLPASIEDLLVDGRLIEVHGRRPPVR